MITLDRHEIDIDKQAHIGDLTQRRGWRVVSCRITEGFSLSAGTLSSGYGVVLPRGAATILGGGAVFACSMYCTPARPLLRATTEKLSERSSRNRTKCRDC